MPPDPLNANDPIDYDYVFTQAAEGKGGLDDPANAPAGLSRYYEYTTIDGKQYQFPWKAVATNQSDQVSIKSTKGDFPTTIGFQLTPEGGESKPLSAQASSTPDKKTLSLLGGYHQQLATLSAYVIQQDTVNDTKTATDIAALKIISYSVLQKKVIIVPVNGATASQSSIETALNNIYAQAITEWEVTVQPYTTEAADIPSLSEGESGAFTQFTPGMKAFNKAYKKAHQIDKDAYYIFLVNGTTGLDGHSDRQGYMPFNRQYGYIFLDNLSDDLGTVIAHELGHGAFKLEHPESEFGTTLMKDNLMHGSTAGTALKKYQWDNIHDPLNNSGWQKDDEESGLGGDPEPLIITHIRIKLQELSGQLGSKLFSVIHCETCEENSGTEIADGATFTEIPKTLLNELEYNNATFKLPSTQLVSIEQIRKGTGICYAFYFSADSQNDLEFELEKLLTTPTDESLIDKKLILLDNENNIGYHCTNQLGDWSKVICSYQNGNDLAQSYIDDLFKHLEECQNEFADLASQYETLTPKQITYIYENDQLLTIDPVSGASIKDISENELEQLIANLKNDALSDDDAVIYKKLAKGYQVYVNFGENIIPKSGYDPTGTAKDDSEKVLEQVLNLKLGAINSLTDKNVQNAPGVFNDGKKISIKETDWWESVSNLVSATNEFIADVEIKAKYWDSGDGEYNKNWMNTPPYLSGAGNGVIEEIKEIPELVFMVANIAVDEPTRTKLWNSLKELDREKIANGLYGMGESYVNTFAEGGDPAWHQGGKTTVQVATIFFGGALKKGAGAVKDNIDEISDALKKKADDVLNEALEIMAELKSKVELDDISWSKFEADFDADIVNLKKFGDNPDLVGNWKYLDDAGVDETLRKNLDALTDPDAALDAIQATQKSKPTWEEIKVLFIRGNDFNKKALTKYKYNEINLSTGKRLDSYIPGKEIVSRKATDLSKIKTSTFENYLKELTSKYKKGITIRSNKYKSGSGAIDGSKLSGEYFLEIPTSNIDFFNASKSLQDLAIKYNVKIKVTIQVLKKQK